MHPFDEAVGLWMIRRRWMEFGAEEGRELTPQFRDELAAAIRRDGGGRPESGDPTL
jgi:hypothetical protein